MFKKCKTFFESPIVLCLTLCVLVILPVALLRDITPDNELRYLSITDEALSNGNFWTFTNQGIPYADKPPLFFWWIMLSRMLLGEHYLFMAAFISIIPMIGVIWVFDKMTRQFMSQNTRILSILMLFSMGIFSTMGFILRPDMLMTLFIALAIYQFYLVQIKEQRQKYHLWLFGFFVFMGLFSKGVVGLIMPLAATCTYLLATKNPRRILTFWGWRTWLVLLIGCAIWFGGVFLEGGKDYLYNLTVHQTVDRSVNAFHHKQPFYYYFIVIWYLFLPWSFLGIFGLIRTFKQWKTITELQKLFALAIVSTFILLSISSGKVAIYLLPLMPFMLFLVMSDLPSWNKTLWSRLALLVPAIIMTVAFPGALYYLLTNHFLSVTTIGLLLASVVATICGVKALILLYKNSDASKIILAISLSVISLFIGCDFSIPFVNELSGFKTLCADAQQLAAEYNITQFGTVNVRRSENMDAYLYQDITQFEPEKLTDGSLNNMVIMAKKSKIKNIVLPPESIVRESSLGQYLIIAFPPEQ